MAQAPAHIRLDDAERLLPPCLLSLSATVKQAKLHAPVRYPIRLTVRQAEEIIFAYKDLRERLGVCRNELAYERLQGPRQAYGHTFVRRRKPAKAVSVASKGKVASKWAKVLEGLGKGETK